MFSLCEQPAYCIVLHPLIWQITKKNAERVVVHREEEQSCVLVAMWMDSSNPPIKVVQAIDLIGVEPPESYFQIVINPFSKGIIIV